MKKIKIAVGVIFCIMAILSAIGTSLVSSLHYTLNVIDLQLCTILIHVFVGLIALFTVAGALFIGWGVSDD